MRITCLCLFEPGVSLSRADVKALGTKVDHDGSGSVGMEEFFEIVTETLMKQTASVQVCLCPGTNTFLGQHLMVGGLSFQIQLNGPVMRREAGKGG